MEALIGYVSLAGSVVSTLVTGYFWFARMRNERPHVVPYLHERELFLGTSRDQVRQVGAKLGIALANFSTLPNALLGLRVWVKAKSGAFLPLDGAAVDKATPLPANLAPLATLALRIQGNLSFPYQDALETGATALSAYAKEHLAEPLTVRVELRQLLGGTRTHDAVLGA